MKNNSSITFRDAASTRHFSVFCWKNGTSLIKESQKACLILPPRIMRWRKGNRCPDKTRLYSRKGAFAGGQSIDKRRISGYTINYK